MKMIYSGNLFPAPDAVKGVIVMKKNRRAFKLACRLLEESTRQVYCTKPTSSQVTEQDAPSIVKTVEEKAADRVVFFGIATALNVFLAMGGIILACGGVKPDLLTTQISHILSNLGMAGAIMFTALACVTLRLTEMYDNILKIIQSVGKKLGSAKTAEEKKSGFNPDESWKLQ